MALPLCDRTHRNGLIGSTGPRRRHRRTARDRKHTNSRCEMVDPLRTQDGRVRRRADLTLHNKRVLPLGHPDVRTRSQRAHMGGLLGDDVVDDLAIVVHIRVLLDIQVAEHDIKEKILKAIRVEGMGGVI